MFRTLRQSAAVGAGDLVDDALDEDDSYMDAAGYVGRRSPGAAPLRLLPKEQVIDVHVTSVHAPHSTRRNGSAW